LIHFFFKDSDLETDLQELAEAKTGGKGGDGPNVREEVASNTEPVEMPEAGMSSIQKVIYVVSVFSEYYIFNNIEGTLLLF
jgi:hypothetical protein